MSGRDARKDLEESRRTRRPLAPRRPFGELEPWASVFGPWPSSSRFPRLMDELLRDWLHAGRDGAGFLPPMDVREGEDAYAITIELPGVGRDDVHVALHGRTLTVRGEKASERETAGQRGRAVERRFGSFRRSFRLPADADADHLEASFEDGVLTIRIPRTQRPPRETVPIESD